MRTENCELRTTAVNIDEWPDSQPSRFNQKQIDALIHDPVVCANPRSDLDVVI